MEHKTYRTSPRDFFLHLLSIVTLYGSAVSFLTLIFQYINVVLPDATDYAYAAQAAYGAMRGAIATLVVVFPAYLFTMRFLKREYAREPERRESKIRRWLVYFTLFAAALIVIGDVVTLLYRFLEGDTTLRFFLKVLAVFFAAGSVFGYYFTELKHEQKGEKSAFRPYWTYGISLVVLIALVAGTLTVGSPKTGRMQKFDERRVQDLQMIQSQIVNYWVNTRTLPENLSMIENTAAGFVVPADPETGSAYAYEKKGELQFAVCADFSTEAQFGNSTAKPVSYGFREESWDHGAGHVCFDRAINPDLYEPAPKR